MGRAGNFTDVCTKFDTAPLPAFPLPHLPPPPAPNLPTALLRSLQENPKMKEYLVFGWGAEFELCSGPQSIETLWTGVECVDPEKKPGIVSKL